MDQIKVRTQDKMEEIHAELHGQFLEHLGTCINGGVWVGKDSDIPNREGIRMDVLNALKKISSPLVRWPGGCFADTYHWRDGIGPQNERPATYNPVFGTHAMENNQFGTHEFMDLCSEIGAEPWLNVNMMTGSVSEMVAWAEYCNRKEPTSLSRERATNGNPEPFDVRFWGIGNESWAGGGNYTADSYASEYRKYASAFPVFANPEPNAMPKRQTNLIAVGADGNKPKERVAWTRDLFASLAKYRQPPIDALDLHFYNWNIDHPDDAVTGFTEQDWFRVLAGSMEIEQVILEQYDLIQEGIANFPKTEGPFAMQHDCSLIIGEWGNWHRMDQAAPSALWQQCTMRDALTSAMTLDIFHRNCGNVRAACVAQTVNVLNSLILTDGASTILTPTYHVFDLYQVHRNSQKLGIEVQSEHLTDSVPAVLGFASIKGDIISINVINADLSSSRQVILTFDATVIFAAARSLHSDHPTDHNSAVSPDLVTIQNCSQPIEKDGRWLAEVPPASVSVYQFKLA